MLHFADRMLYVGAGWSQLDKVYAFICTSVIGNPPSFNLDKIYLTDTGQWFENRAFDILNPTAMITTQAMCSSGKCDATRDLNRPTFYGAHPVPLAGKMSEPASFAMCRSAVLFRRRKCGCR